MGMWILSQDTAEEGRAGRQYHFVSLHLGIITGESDVKEVLLLAEFAECDTDVAFEVIPT